MIRGSFPRRIDALDEIVDFTATALADSSLTNAQRHTVDFTIEELFTNMVKYGRSGAPEIAIEIDCVEGGADVTLIDCEVERFDPTRAPDADTELPIEQRTPGGLGIHVLRRLVGSLSYEYIAARREGRTRFQIPRKDTHVDD